MMTAAANATIAGTPSFSNLRSILYITHEWDVSYMNPVVKFRLRGDLRLRRESKLYYRVIPV